MNTITVRILVFFLSLFIMITVFSQISLQFKDDYITETAVIYSSAEKVAFQGVYIRNETVINGSVNGVLSYPSPDGSKIANGSVIAYVYENENDIFINQQIQKLKEEVELLKSAQNPGTTDVVRPEFIASLIDEHYQKIAVLIAENDLEALYDERKEFQTLMDIYQIVINNETNFDETINEINLKIAELEKKQREPSSVITSESTGYFISYTDGFEDKLSPENINGLTVDEIKEIISSSPQESESNSIGKMVDGYEWKMVGIVNPEETDFRIGSTVTVSFSSTPNTVTATIENLIKSDNHEESIIVLSCDELTYDLVQRRSERVAVILNDYEGIKVPRNAIRFDKNNEKGVYILLGQRIAFKKIKPVYECDDYILSQITSDTNYVSVYDDIILEGEISSELYAEESSASEYENKETQSDETIISDEKNVS